MSVESVDSDQTAWLLYYKENSNLDWCIQMKISHSKADMKPQKVYLWTV